MGRTNRIRSCLIALLLLVAAPNRFSLSPSFAHADDVKKAKIVIDNPIFSYGSVVQGAQVAHDFVVSNPGNDTLTIQRVVAGCGCTATNVSSPTVAPGQTATIRVLFDTSGFSGDKEKTVRVFTNDAENPTALITLKGYVETAVTLDPARLSFGEIKKGDTTTSTKEFTVSLKEGTDLRIADIKTVSKGLSVKVLDGNDMHKHSSVTITPDAPSGEFRDRIIVNLTKKNGETQTVNLPVIASIKTSLVLSPQVVSMGIIEGKDPIEREVRLDNRATEPLAIKGIESDNPAVEATITTNKDGKQYLIHVKVIPSRVTNDLRATIRITTDSKEQEQLVLNVYGVLPPKTS